MRLSHLAIVVMLVALLAIPAWSAERWIEFVPGASRDVAVDLLASDTSVLALDITVPGVTAEDLLTRGGPFVRLSLPSYGHTLAEGEPMLPVIRELVEIPYGAVPTVTASAAFERLSLESAGVVAPIVPTQPPIEKVPGALESAPFVLSEAAYARNAFGPDELAALGEIRELRGHRFAVLEVNPIRYNPVSGEIEVATQVSVDVRFEGADQAETRSRLARYSNAYSEQVAGDLFLNHDAFRSRYDMPLPIGYLIVVHDSFYDQILPLAEWKDDKGYECTVVKTSQIPGGNTKENIKAYIQNAYDTWPAPPTFVLLVGDTGYISHWVGNQSNYPTTDLYYVTMDGAGDWVPDIWIGRMSCTTAEQVTNLVNKTLDYERFDLASGTAWIKKAVFMASSDNFPVTEGTHNYVISTYMDPAGYTSDKLYCRTYHATTQQVRDAFNDGRSLGIYSGHGDVTYWADGPVFTATDVNNLTNTDKLPLVHSYACLTGQFSSACFGETWINATDKGALVFWGSSVTSYWTEDDYLERGAFKAVFDEGYTWAAGISHRALYWLYQQFSGGGSTHRYFEMYNVLGDPSVDIWTNPPATLSASYPASIPVGTGAIDVTVTSGGSPVGTALVCVKKEDEGVYATAYTNSSGLAQIVIDPAPLTAGTMSVTASKHDGDPFEGTVLVEVEGGVGDEEVELVPESLALGQNRPNPFNPVTTVSYAVPEAGRVTIAVFNVAGARVRTLVDADDTPGFRAVVWDGTDDAGQALASGVYYCRLTSGGRSEQRAMVLLK